MDNSTVPVAQQTQTSVQIKKPTTKKLKAGTSAAAGGGLMISDDLQIEQILKTAREPQQLKYSQQQLQQQGDPICSRLQAQACLRKLGIHVLGKKASDMMIIGARHGLIRLIKFFQSALCPLSIKNQFSDTIYHSAAIAGQEKVVFWLLK